MLRMEDVGVVADSSKVLRGWVKLFPAFMGGSIIHRNVSNFDTFSINEGDPIFVKGNIKSSTSAYANGRSLIILF